MLFGGFFMSKAKEKKEVTTNQGKKHLFGSSEKSDFILNMSAESAQKLCGVYSIIAVLVLCVITIPYSVQWSCRHSFSVEWPERNESLSILLAI